MGKIVLVDGVEYLPASEVKTEIKKGEQYCIVRTYSAGVFAGYIDPGKIKGGEGSVKNARRLWYWEGAASLSQLAKDGVSKPKNCKFPTEVEVVHLLNIIEIIPATEIARKSIAEVEVWSE